ncbi:MAG: Mbeg1-like protein [Bulleidia sp.]
MDTLKDYLLWYRNIPLEEDSFSDADNFMLAYLSYLDFSESCDSDHERTLSEHVRILKEKHLLDRKDSVADRELILLAADTERFGNLILRNYEDHFDEKHACQFGAVEIVLNESCSYLSFRGTDTSIAGWKEDFMISFTKTMAQQYALRYAERVMKPGRKYLIGGHSKGANLALYCSAMVDKEKQDQIIRIYMNDGPGFCSDVLDITAIDAIRDRIRIIEPEYCVIGKLFEPDVKDHYIVRSSTDGIMAHLMESWGIDHGKPLKADRYQAGSIYLSQVFDQWIEKVPIDQRRKFVDDLFDVLSQDGSHTMMDIAEKGPAGFENVVVQLIGMEKTSRNNLVKLPLTALFGNIPERMKNQKLNQFLKTEAGGAILILLAGIICIAAPDTILEQTAGLILLAAVVSEAVLTIRRLAACHWNFQQEKLRVYICIALAAVYVLILVKDQALFLIASAFFGSVLLMSSYASLSGAAANRTRKGIYWRSVAETLLFGVSGGYILIAPDRGISWYMVSLGSVLIADAAVRLIQIARSGKENMNAGAV